MLSSFKQVYTHGKPPRQTQHVATPLKNMKVNEKDDIPYMKWKNKTCSKPPNSHSIVFKHCSVYVAFWWVFGSIQKYSIKIVRKHSDKLAFKVQAAGLSHHIPSTLKFSPQKTASWIYSSPLGPHTGGIWWYLI